MEFAVGHGVNEILVHGGTGPALSVDVRVDWRSHPDQVPLAAPAVGNTGGEVERPSRAAKVSGSRCSSNARAASCR